MLRTSSFSKVLIVVSQNITYGDIHGSFRFLRLHPLLASLYIHLLFFCSIPQIALQCRSKKISTSSSIKVSFEFVPLGGMSGSQIIVSLSICVRISFWHKHCQMLVTIIIIMIKIKPNTLSIRQARRETRGHGLLQPSTFVASLLPSTFVASLLVRPLRPPTPQAS